MTHRREKPMDMDKAFSDLVRQIELGFITDVDEILDFVASGDTDFIKWCKKKGYCR